MTGHQDTAQAVPTTGAASPRCPECQTIGGHSLFCPRYQAPAWSLAPPCQCWSCGGQCGGTNHPDSCGPRADLDGRPVCRACRAAADVLDDYRAGIKVTLDSGRVRVRSNVWAPGSPSAWLEARSARHLAAVLSQRAAELDRQTAEEDGADQLAETPIDLWPTTPGPYDILPEHR